MLFRSTEARNTSEFLFLEEGEKNLCFICCRQMDEPLTPSSLFADSATPCAFSIPDDTQVYFTDSEHQFFAFVSKTMPCLNS